MYKIYSSAALRGVVVVTALGSISAHAKERDYFPARLIVQSIMKAEASIERAYTQSLGQHNAGEIGSINMEWIPSLLPASSRTWMYVKMPPKALEKLQRNLDLQDRPIF